MKVEAGHLAEGMYAGIGASGTLGQGCLTGHPPERGLQFSLDGGPAGLDLPSAEIASVVGKGSLPVLRFTGLRSLGQNCVLSVTRCGDEMNPRATAEKWRFHNNRRCFRWFAGIS